jgi:putative SOS response-associated peptidase YedK
LAGLDSWWKDHLKPEDDRDSWTLTGTILTSDAVDELLRIHDRNPVMLPPEWWDPWLDPTFEGTQDFVDAAVQAALPVASSLEVYQVAPIPYSADGPSLIEPVTQIDGTENWISMQS